MAAGNTAEACARFAESYRLEASSGTLINLALCHEKEGKIATAWAEYRDAARVAQDQGRKDRAAAANDKAAALEPKVPRLTTVAAKPVAGLDVSSEARSLTEGGFGVAVPIDLLRDLGPAAARTWTTTPRSASEQRTLEIHRSEGPRSSTRGRSQAGGEIIAVAAQSGAERLVALPSSPVGTAVGGERLIVAGGVAYRIACAKLRFREGRLQSTASARLLRARVDINTWASRSDPSSPGAPPWRCPDCTTASGRASGPSTSRSIRRTAESSCAGRSSRPPSVRQQRDVVDAERVGRRRAGVAHDVEADHFERRRIERRRRR
jgi:hypothetical protein